MQSSSLRIQKKKIQSSKGISSLVSVSVCCLDVFPSVLSSSISKVFIELSD